FCLYYHSFFFFSSRRRHTRSKRDWSSDVCSSDLPTFHPHACTYVETPAEIDELLARTDVGLTLDTGHLILGGGDPLTGLRRWADRIDHLHLKDVRRAVLEEAVATGAGMRRVWTGRAFVPLGEGDLDLEAVMELVTGGGHSGGLGGGRAVLPQVGGGAGGAGGDQ